MKAKSQQEGRRNFFDDSMTHWSTYALRRLPWSCLVSIFTLISVLGVYFYGSVIYGWFAG